MVTIYSPSVSAATESVIEEKIVETENTMQCSTLSEAFVIMRRNLRDELRDVVNAEWTDNVTNNTKIIKVTE